MRAGLIGANGARAIARPGGRSSDNAFDRLYLVRQRHITIEVVLFEVAGKLATVSLGDGIPRILKYFIDFP